MILASSASLPPGCKLSGNALTITLPATFDGWDFEGLEVFVEADVTFNRPRFHNTVNAHVLHVGENGKAPNVTINLGDFDGSSLKGASGESALQLATGNLFTNGCRWHDGARDYVTMFTGSWTALGDHFGLCGIEMDPSSHIEPAHINGGNVTWDGCVFDMRLFGRPKPVCGWTATVANFQAKTAPVVAKIRNSILRAPAELSILYAIQTNPRTYPVSLDLRGNSVELGIHGKLVGDTPGVGGVTKLTGSNNRNAVTGVAWAVTK